LNVPQPSDVSHDYEVIIPCKTSLVDRAVVILPLHSTPMDEVPIAMYVDHLEHTL